jgi:hypothetical protein
MALAEFNFFQSISQLDLCVAKISGCFATRRMHVHLWRMKKKNQEES